MEKSGETLVVRVPTKVPDILDNYLEHRRQDLRTMLKALDRGEFEHILQVAHALAGNGGSFGFEGISQIGSSLVSVVENSRNEEIQQLLEDLAGYLSRVAVAQE